MKKISRTAKIWLSETFLNSIISQFQKNSYVVLFIIGWLVNPDLFTHVTEIIIAHPNRLY